MKKWSNIKQKINDLSDQFQNDLNNQNNQNSKGKRENHYQKNYSTSNPEQVIGTMWSYFTAFWLGIFISMFAILILLPNPKTSFLAILIIIALPFWAVFCFIMMVPDVKIFGVTVFSRRNLSLRKSVSFGKRIVYAFSKEFFRQNPTMATFLFVYLFLIIIAVIFAVS
jgi:hypothetical protein